MRLRSLPGPGDPWPLLGLLLLAQWAAVVVFVLVVHHNGWLFYQGGDETFFYTDSWVLAHGHIPEATIGYGWSYLLAPVAAIAGPDYLAAIPAIVLLQTVVLMPVALYCVYEIAARIGGRGIGYLAAALWVATPFALIPLFDQRYHAKYVEQLLPQAFGLTGLGDFPSMVCLLVAALGCVRALDSRAWPDAALGGLAAGFAIGIKPANVLFIAGPVLAFAFGRHVRGAAAFGAALLPALMALALWKYRGLGHLPITSQATVAAAAGLHPVVPLGDPFSRYADLDWSRLGDNYTQLREFLPTTPVLQALPLAGLVGGLLRSRPKTLLLAGWLGAFLLVKGTSDQASIEGGTLLRLLIPAFPALLLLVALVPLLFRAAWDPSPGTTPVAPRWVVAGGAVFACLPVVLFVAFSPLREPTVTKYFDENVMVPVDRAFSVRLRGRVLTWHAPPSPGVAVFYRVFRERPLLPAPDPTLPPGRDGIRCLETASDRAADCRLEMHVIGTTRATRFVDRPPPGRWVYRVGLAANWRDDPAAGDVLVLSPAARR